MNHQEQVLYALTIVFEILLCALVYLRNLQRRLPFFAAHSVILLVGTMSLLAIYRNFGFRSTAAYDTYWVMAGLIMIARAFAVAELCRVALRPYPGIWALTWRLLGVLAILLIANAAVDAWGQIDRIAIYGLTIERDFAISSVVLLLVIVLIRYYYRLRTEPLHHWIAVGMFMICAVDVVNDTVLRHILTGSLSYWLFARYAALWGALQPRVEHANVLWGVVRVSAFFASICVWALALRKALPLAEKGPQLLPTEVYGELSPAINLRLRALNDRLVEMLQQ